jgi:hypothetical protein
LQIGQLLIPRKLDLDSSPLNIPFDTSYFMKGIEVDWLNSGDGIANSGEVKPEQGNQLYCSVVLPAGENQVIGYYFFEEATEGYVIVYNSNNNHLIYRLEGLTGQCRVVYRFCPPSLPMDVPMNPIIDIILGGNLVEGLNTGTITGTPGTKVLVKVATEVGITTGNIDNATVNAGEGTTSYELLFPASGIINYDMVLANTSPVPQLSVYAFKDPTAQNNIIIPTAFGGPTYSELVAFFTVGSKIMFAPPIGQLTITGQAQYGNQQGIVLTFSQNVPTFNYGLFLATKVPTSILTATAIVETIGDEYATKITNNPKDFFSEGRIAIKSICKYLPDGTPELYKEMLLVNKKITNARIVIEDSIATNSFTTPFFTPKNSCCGDCNRIIKVGVPTPMADIKVVPIPATPADADIQNELLFKMFKFRFKDINGWGQVSEHGKISDSFFNNLSACSKDAAGSPHCVWLETKTPCPEIVKRIIEVQTCALKGDTGVTDGAILSDWKEYATIDLYDQSDPNLKWYDRVYKTNNNEFEFFNNGKDIRFKFCNNRECKTIPFLDVRDENPAPFTSGTVAAIGKGLIYGDNDNDFDKVLEADKEGVSFEVEPTVGCDIKYAHIKMYAVIHNNFHKNACVWFYSENTPPRTGFGGVFNNRLADPVMANENVVPVGAEGAGYGQYFPDGIKGFRAVLAGTGHQAESKQMVWTPTSPLALAGVLGLGATGLADVQAYMGTLAPGQKVLVQEFDFGLVPQGKYYARIMGHNDTEALPYTSTFTLCKTSWNGYKQSHAILTGDYIKEIYIDTSTGVDYDGLASDEVAVIMDLTGLYDALSKPVGESGYLYEDVDGKQPIELAEVTSVGGGITSRFTDHNGFYFHSRNNVDNQIIIIKGYNKCLPNQILATPGIVQGVGIRKEVMFAEDKFPDYVTDLCNRYIISGTIKECGLTTGVAGISIVLGRSRPVQTNNLGQFRLVAHFNQARGSDLLLFSIGASCNVVDCNCEPVAVSFSVPQPLCTSCILNEVPVGNFNLRTILRRGFEHGSRVPIGIEAHDWLGRRTDIQDMESWTVNIPTEQEQGDSSYPRIRVNLPLIFSADFVRRFKYLTFFFGKNIAYDDFFEWSADKIEFIDSAGKVNAASPSKVRVWYRSLNEYNLLRGFKTNTTWKIIDTAGDSRVGDIVEFIQNADGKYLPPGLFGNVQYDKYGTYFLVDYDQSFESLKDGVRFKLKRPSTCETSRAYYEYAFTINFCGKDGIPRDDNGNIVTFFYLDGFTAYMQPRQIPVVTDVIDIIPIDGGGTQERVSQKKEIKVYPFNFEHHSPSDTWGDHCFSGGRIGYKNPYEGRKCNRNQLLLTGALNYINDGAINYLHYFSLADEFLLDEQGWGGIMAIIVRNDGQIMLICQTTTFSLAYNDDRAVVTADGYVKLPTNAKFGKPDKDDAWAFGCQAKDLNTIRRNGPIVMYMDSQKCAVVIHNFATAVDISAGIKSWLTEGIKRSIGNDNIYFHGNFDNRGDKKIYHLTRFDRTLAQFVNQEIEVDHTKNETVSYNLLDKHWGPLKHFTPEYFGNMYGEAKDTQFFSFKDGLPYSHHNAITAATKYLNYFGIQCFPVIGVVTNKESTKVKSFLWSEVYCFEQLFILEKIVTEMGQKSRLLEGKWEWGEGFWKGEYLCDTEYIDNSDPTAGDSIIDGDTLFGRWLKGTYIAYNKKGSPYEGTFFKLTAIISFVFPREKSSQ